MHYCCEIVMPATADVEGAVRSILAPFDENGEDRSNTFWDFYVIGGRFAGAKLQAMIGDERIQRFYDWLKAEEVTVSSFQAGKQTLQPEDQIPKVDAKWNEMFPDAPGPCPLFSHSSNQYGADLKSSTLAGDICPLDEVPAGYEPHRVIFAAPSYSSDTKERTGPFEATFMLTEDVWNGCNHMKVDWDGKFTSALEKYRESISRYRDEVRGTFVPTADWIAVTVDYHS